MVCLECGLDFETRRSLHAHIKAHSMSLGEYYVKNLPRYDLLTGELLPFKNYDNYVITDFRNKKNMYKWIEGVSERQEAEEYCRRAFERYMKGNRDIKYAPNHLFLLTHPRLPKFEHFGKQLIVEICEAYGLTLIFDKTANERPDFLSVPKEMSIFIDSREQDPLKFGDIKTVEMKLDFGDYTAVGKDYSYTYVERKSENDFKGTMSAGYERFCRELERCRELGSYMFILIESDFRQIYKNNNKLGKKKTNLAYTWENMRNIIGAYSDVCQFIFSGSRENSSLLVPYLLKNGDSLKRTDLQFFMEKMKWLG